MIERGVIDDPERCYRAVSSRDPRFDGWFVVAVVTTGIYCRPSCPAMTPRRPNVRFFPAAAAAQRAGFRACKRCRPDASPGSPEWNVRADVVARAMRLIADGIVDREGVSGLATRLGYSVRQLNRVVTAELGAGPLSVARAQRAQTARVLIESTDLPLGDVAFAAGFGSVRQFNDTVQGVFATTPSELRAGRRRDAAVEAAPGWVSLRLPTRAPFHAPSLFGFLAARAVTGIEEAGEDRYARTLDLPHGPGVVVLRPESEARRDRDRGIHERRDRGRGDHDSDPDRDDHGRPGGRSGITAVRAALRVGDWRDIGPAVQRCRRLLDLDADPVAVDAVLGADPVLAGSVAMTQGMRAPASVSGVETVVRAVVGQQVSVAAAHTIVGRLVAALGTPLTHPHATLTHVFPTARRLAEVDPALLPMPLQRKRTLAAVCSALADGAIPLDEGADRGEVVRALQEVPGIGPWTAAYVAMRGLGDPDVFLPTDLGVRSALAALGGTPADAERWRPWRSYAVHHLWAALGPPGRRGGRPR